MDEKVYQATHGVPELGIETGDQLIVRPGHRRPLTVVRDLSHQDLCRLVSHLDGFELRSSEPTRPAYLQLVPKETSHA